MSETVGDFLLARLAGEWGVERIYGYPGDGINGTWGPSSGRGFDRPARHQAELGP
jgi:hypothetical protein